MAASRSASAPTSATHSGSRCVSFARIQEPLKVPDLLALQTESFDWLLGNERWQARIKEAKEAGRKDVSEQSGLEEIFENKTPKSRRGKNITTYCYARCCQTLPGSTFANLCLT